MRWETAALKKGPGHFGEWDLIVLQWLTALTRWHRQDNMMEKQIGDITSTSGNEEIATEIYFDVHT